MKQEIQEIVIPSSEEDRKKIRDAFNEISGSKTRVLAERDFQKEVIAELSEKFNIPKRTLNYWAKAYHNDSFDKEAKQADDLEAAAILIMKKEPRVGSDDGSEDQHE